MHTIRVVIATAVALALGGCTTLGLGPGFLQLSTLKREELAMRNGLSVRPERFAGPARYRPTRECSYAVYRKNAPLASSMRFHIAAFQARLRLTITDDEGISTALFESDGKLDVFNITDGNGERINSDDFTQKSQRERTRASTETGRRYDVVNPLQNIIPRFDRSAWSPGEVVSIVRTLEGRTWAYYTYRGKAQFRGSDVLVLDLFVPDATGSETLIGFNLVDPETMAPVVSAKQDSAAWRFERVSCQ